MRLVLSFLGLHLIAAPAAAHPLTDIRYDRTIAIRLGDREVVAIYTLEVSLFGLHLDAARRLSKEDIASLDKSVKGYAAVYARRLAPELQQKLRAYANGVPLAWTVSDIDISFTDHAICRFTLRATWPPGDRRYEFRVSDETFAEMPGTINLTIDRRGDAGLDLVDVDEPIARLRSTLLANLTAEEASRARNATAILVLPTPINSAVNHPVLTEPAVTVTVEQAPNLITDLSRRGLPALFDSTYGVGILLLAAFLFGAAHAFTPGHGKTLVAAYLVGERGTVKHAIILALATTIAHTGSVIAVAAILWGVYGNNVPGATQGTLQFVAGLLVMGVGLWLLLRRVSGQADHFHLFGPGHSHDHSHGNGHHHHGPLPESAKSTGGWVRIVLMGLGGGLVPCWDAVLLLVAASAMGRLDFALPLLFAFSLGLGLVLVGLGIGVVFAFRAGSKRFQESRWFRLLPTASAMLLVGIGFWLCKQAVGMVAGN